MSFLKKLGQIIAIGTEVALGIGPILSKSLPGAAGVVATAINDLELIKGVVIQAEAMGAALGLSGADKLRAATGPVVQILATSFTAAGHPVKDPAALNAAAQDIINGVVKALNAIDPSIIETKAIG